MKTKITFSFAALTQKNAKPEKQGKIPPSKKDPDNIQPKEPNPDTSPKKEPGIQPGREPLTLPSTTPPDVPMPPSLGA